MDVGTWECVAVVVVGLMHGRDARVAQQTSTHMLPTGHCCIDHKMGAILCATLCAHSPTVPSA